MAQEMKRIVYIDRNGTAHDGDVLENKNGVLKIQYTDAGQGHSLEGVKESKNGGTGWIDAAAYYADKGGVQEKVAEKASETNKPAETKPLKGKGKKK